MGKKEVDGKVSVFNIEPAPPKKPLSAFFLYRQEVYGEVKAKHPNARITQLTKIISEMWGKVSGETKDRLEEQYKKNKEIAAKEKEEYEQKYGKIERKKKKKIKKGKKDDSNQDKDDKSDSE